MDKFKQDIQRSIQTEMIDNAATKVLGPEMGHKVAGMASQVLNRDSQAGATTVPTHSGGGGIGQYAKMAQDFMGHGQTSGQTRAEGPAAHSSGGGSIGQYSKMAQNFMGHETQQPPAESGGGSGLMNIAEGLLRRKEA
ncbi:hypothetical protein HDV05_005646 [Chytridiales sp. JEL 0842]|nr:hypothetical protein HDV05_005646 [Chytridiales sp. JEL 0842]